MLELECSGLALPLCVDTNNYCYSTLSVLVILSCYQRCQAYVAHAHAALLQVLEESDWPGVHGHVNEVANFAQGKKRHAIAVIMTYMTCSCSCFPTLNFAADHHDVSLLHSSLKG